MTQHFHKSVYSLSVIQPPLLQTDMYKNNNEKIQQKGEKRPNEWLRSNHRCTHVWWPCKEKKDDSERSLMGPSCFFFSYGNPCRSETPSINTRRSDISLSFDRTSAKVLESLLEPNHGESPKRKKMIKKEKKKMEGNQSSSTPVVAASRSKAVDQPWLQWCSFKEGGCSTVWYFYLFPPSAVKVGGAWRWKKAKGNLHPPLLMVEIFLAKSLEGINAHLKKCSREYLMQTSELVVYSTTL